jgi:hypothetical protein
MPDIEKNDFTAYCTSSKLSKRTYDHNDILVTDGAQLPPRRWQIPYSPLDRTLSFLRSAR